MFTLLNNIIEGHPAANLAASALAEAGLTARADDGGARAAALDPIVYLPGPYEGRLAVSGFPGRGVSSSARADRSLPPLDGPDELARRLRAKFGEGAQFVVWNLSGVTYDASALHGNVVEYDSPGRPVPPLDVLAEISGAVHAWLARGDDHVAVVHDLSGRRAALVAACAIELARSPDVESALHSVVVPALGAVGRALVASQHRYFDYFCALRALPTRPVEGAPPDEPPRPIIPSRPLVLLRVIVNGVPTYPERTSGAPAGGEGGGGAAGSRPGCRARMEVFDRDGRLVGETAGAAPFTSAAEGSLTLTPRAPPSLAASPGLVVVDGDALLKFSHEMDADRDPPQLVAMFAFAVHTGFVRKGDLVLRFSANDVDGAATNPRIPREFFVDVIFGEPGSVPVPVPAPASESASAGVAPPPAGAGARSPTKGARRAPSAAAKQQPSSSSAAPRGAPPAPAALTTLEEIDALLSQTDALAGDSELVDVTGLELDDADFQ